MVRQDGWFRCISLHRDQNVALVSRNPPQVALAHDRTSLIWILELNGAKLDVVHWVHWHGSQQAGFLGSVGWSGWHSDVGRFAGLVTVP